MAYLKNNHCVVCDKRIDDRAMKCPKCANKNKGGWNRGVHMWKDKIHPATNKVPWNKGIEFKHSGSFKNKEQHPNWKGGSYIRKGYVLKLAHGHPYANPDGYVLEHRLVMEKHIGRYLLPTEEVHHLDFDTTNNNIENLKLFETKGKHSKYHYFLRECVKEAMMLETIQ